MTDTDTSLDTSYRGPLNRNKLWFLLCAIAMLSAGFWLCLQISASGITLAGRTGFLVLFILALLGGIVGPMMNPKIPARVLGGLLGAIGAGMILGIFLPQTIFRIPPDFFSTLVGSISAQFSQEDPTALTIVVLAILLVLAVTFFVGSALTRVGRWLYGWLHN
jgi:hypothetical protein